MVGIPGLGNTPRARQQAARIPARQCAKAPLPMAMPREGQRRRYRLAQTCGFDLNCVISDTILFGESFKYHFDNGFLAHALFYDRYQNTADQLEII